MWYWRVYCQDEVGKIHEIYSPMGFLNRSSCETDLEYHILPNGPIEEYFEDLDILFAVLEIMLEYKVPYGQEQDED